ncbi:MAG: prohibitin family protein [Rhodobacteraceae bacterium]|nr:prohibitin family protein [Paracoccaceae bacterium]
MDVADLAPQSGVEIPKKHRLRWAVDSAAKGLLAFLAILLILGAALYPAVVRIIPAGSAGVLYKPLSNGTITDRVFQEGVHVKYPWDKLYIYDIRIQTILHDFTTLTNKGLPVTLKLAIRYHPERELVGMLHKHIGPNYAEVIVINQIESVLRRRLGQADPEEIYTNKAGILTSVLQEAGEEAGQRYVKITGVLIREVVLPPRVAAAVEDKLVYQQQLEAYEFRIKQQRKEAERLKIEAGGIHDYLFEINRTLNDRLINWQGIQATLELARSNNAKVVVIGASQNGLPLILGGDTFSNTPNGSPAEDERSPPGISFTNVRRTETVPAVSGQPPRAEVADGLLTAAEFLEAPFEVLP